jgi:mycothiol synthase
VRTFEPGRDEEAWLAVNARAFAGHPEQGGWTRADLDDRIGQPWFDPRGFFLAADTRRDGALAGFHWTKVHDGGPEPAGEVYVVGVDPSYQGTGLGKALTVIGVRHLHDHGLRTVELYVDGSNTAARRLYDALGFTEAAVDVQYRFGGA